MLGIFKRGEISWEVVWIILAIFIMVLAVVIAVFWQDMLKEGWELFTNLMRFGRT